MGISCGKAKKSRGSSPELRVWGFIFPRSGIMGLVQSFIPMILELPWDRCDHEYSHGRSHSRDSQPEKEPGKEKREAGWGQHPKNSKDGIPGSPSLEVSGLDGVWSHMGIELMGLVGFGVTPQPKPLQDPRRSHRDPARIGVGIRERDPAGISGFLWDFGV